MVESRLLLQDPGKALSKLVTAQPNEQNTDLEFCLGDVVLFHKDI